MRCLRLENCEFSRLFLCRQLNRFEDTKRIVMDLTEFRNQVHYRKFDGVGDRFILTDLVIIYTFFGSSQPPVSLEITTIISLTKETSATIPKMLMKKELTYSLNTF